MKIIFRLTCNCGKQQPVNIMQDYTISPPLPLPIFPSKQSADFSQCHLLTENTSIQRVCLPLMHCLFHYQGCYDTAITFFEDKLLIIGGVALGIAVFQVICFIFASVTLLSERFLYHRFFTGFPNGGDQ